MSLYECPDGAALPSASSKWMVPDPLLREVVPQTCSQNSKFREVNIARHPGMKSKKAISDSLNISGKILPIGISSKMSFTGKRTCKRQSCHRLTSRTGLGWTLWSFCSPDARTYRRKIDGFFLMTAWQRSERSKGREDDMWRFILTKVPILTAPEDGQAPRRMFLYCTTSRFRK